MSGRSLVNTGELTKPATVLIEKISDAVGGYFRPYQIRRVAQAEADANEIKAIAQLRVDDLQKRALARFVAEEASRQENMEAITSKALPELSISADPAQIEDDWITNFFDKCRLISDEEMQHLWARVLAGEANAPGKYSKRTVNFLDSLDKSDADLFQKVCSVACEYDESLPLIYDVDNAIYASAGLSFANLTHLDEIGLLTYESLSGFALTKMPKTITMNYHGQVLELAFAQEGAQLSVGHVLLSKVGQELASICQPVPLEGFLDFVVGEWMSAGIVCSSPWPATTAA
jgi:hypothetical protein